MSGLISRVIIGGGRFVDIMLSSTIEKIQAAPNDVYVYEEDDQRVDELQKKYSVKVGNNLVPISLAQVIVFTSETKPKENLIKNVSKLVRDGIPIISISHGWTITELEKDFPNHPIIRANNNPFAAYGEGLGIFSTGKVAKEDASAVAFTILSLIGKAIEVPEEILESVSNLVLYEISKLSENMSSFKANCAKAGLSEEQSKTAALQILTGMAKSLEANTAR